MKSHLGLVTPNTVNRTVASKWPPTAHPKERGVRLGNQALADANKAAAAACDADLRPILEAMGTRPIARSRTN